MTLFESTAAIQTLNFVGEFVTIMLVERRISLVDNISHGQAKTDPRLFSFDLDDKSQS